MSKKPWLLAAKVSVSAQVRGQAATRWLGSLSVGVGFVAEEGGRALSHMQSEYFWGDSPRALKVGCAMGARKVGADLARISGGEFVLRPGAALAKADVVFNAEAVFEAAGRAQLVKSLTERLGQALGSARLGAAEVFAGCRRHLGGSVDNAQDLGDPFDELYFHLLSGSRWMEPGGMDALAPWLPRVEAGALARELQDRRAPAAALAAGPRL